MILFLHADDFGMSRHVTAGIVDGFSNGILTSTSILANAPGFDDGVAQWKGLETIRASGRLRSEARARLGDSTEQPFDLGVHLNLTQGSPITTGFPKELLNQQGQFPGIGGMFRRVIQAKSRWQIAIQNELSAQIGRVVDSGLSPTHLNGHQYVEILPAVSELIPELLQRFQIPIVRVALEPCVSNSLRCTSRPLINAAMALVKRHFAKAFHKQARHLRLACPTCFCGTGHAGRVTADLMLRFVQAAQGQANLEIGLHPGQAPLPSDMPEMNGGWFDPLSDLRPIELQMLQNVATAERLSAAGCILGRLASLNHPHIENPRH